MHLLKILDTELQDFRKNPQKGKQHRDNQNPDFSADLLEKTSNNYKQNSAQNQDFVGGRGKDPSLDLEMKAGVGGIGRSRVETYSLDYSIFFRNYNLVTI